MYHPNVVLILFSYYLLLHTGWIQLQNPLSTVVQQQDQTTKVTQQRIGIGLHDQNVQRLERLHRARQCQVGGVVEALKAESLGRQYSHNLFGSQKRKEHANDIDGDANGDSTSCNAGGIDARGIATTESTGETCLTPRPEYREK